MIQGVERFDRGQGSLRGILLLHGFAGSPQDFGDLPDRLVKAGYRVLAPVLPGHATHPSDLADKSVSCFDAAVQEAYAKLREECLRVAVVGFSMGGNLAIRLVRDTPLRKPEALVLVSPYFGIPYKWQLVLPAETWIRILSPLTDYVRWESSPCLMEERSFFTYEVTPTGGLRMLVELADDTYRNPPSRLPPLTLLLYSPKDQVIDRGRLEELAKRWGIKGSLRLEFHQSRHRILQGPEQRRAEETILVFLASAL